MTLFLVVVCIVAIAVILVGGASTRYRRYRSKYEHLGRSLCEPGSWLVRFGLRTLLLDGMIGGHRVCYTVFGDERKGEPINTYLLLEHPVQGNFRFYAGSDVMEADERIRDCLSELAKLEGFCGLTVTCDRTPFPARLIVRPLGFGYRPGLLLWKWAAGAFDPTAIRKDFDALLSLAEGGI